jgi:hypothetical protein
VHADKICKGSCDYRFVIFTLRIIALFAINNEIDRL